MLWIFDSKKFANVTKLEGKVDVYEDRLGSYLMQICSQDMAKSDSRDTVEIFHCIGNFERISDHAIDLCESSEELKDKQIKFSSIAESQINVLSNAIKEILEKTVKAFNETDVELAKEIEPLEQVVDGIISQIRKGHIDRLQTGDCTIEFGFILSDMLNDFERISDHCSNIAVAVIESNSKHFDSHKYLNSVKHGDEFFDKTFNEFKEKYKLNV